jgi:hypothetical protein
MGAENIKSKHNANNWERSCFRVEKLGDRTVKGFITRCALNQNPPPPWFLHWQHKPMQPMLL